MANFNDALFFTLQLEGGYADDPQDAGGPTKYGISTLAHADRNGDGRGDGLIDIDGDGTGDVPVKELTHDQAAAIYRRVYWRPAWDQIRDQAVASRLFAACVLFGMQRAQVMLQRSLNRYSQMTAGEMPLLEDGIAGPVTISRLNAADAPVALGLFRAEQVSLLTFRIAGAPSQRKFARGWLRRVFA